jgi:hypothetical protein
LQKKVAQWKIYINITQNNGGMKTFHHQQRNRIRPLPGIHLGPSLSMQDVWVRQSPKSAARFGESCFPRSYAQIGRKIFSWIQQPQHQRDLIQRGDIKTKTKSAMKKNMNNRASHPGNRTGLINVSRRTAAAAMLAIVATCSFAAQPAQSAKRATEVPAPTSPAHDGGVANVSVTGTNTVVGRIQDDLKDVIAKVEAATMQMSKANASTPGQYSAIVSNTATKIRELATQTLGDGSQMIKEADGLIEKTRGQISRVRGSSTDPKVLVRQKYEQLLPALEMNLSQVMDARSSISKIRAELIKQADVLAANAEFIGFSSDVEATELAIKAFRECLSEVSAFVTRLAKTVDEVGGPRVVRFD